jgi:hypothetical protein
MRWLCVGLMALVLAGCSATTFDSPATFDKVETANGVVDLQGTGHVYTGTYAGHFTYLGGGQNGYARGVWFESWPEGSEVLYGAEIYLPSGFYANQQGQISVMRADDWAEHPNDAYRVGLAVYSDGITRLFYGREGYFQTPIGTGFRIPEGQWTQVLVHQVLSSSAPVNEVSVNGTLLFSNTAANYVANRTVTKMRVGVVAIGAGLQTNPVNLWLDNVFAGT